MRIVDRKTFLALPAGTLYTKYQPCVFADLCIKRDSCGTDDWFYSALTGCLDVQNSDEFIDICEALENDPTRSHPIDVQVEQRDGCYDQDDKFAIYEDADIIKLIAEIALCARGNLADAVP